MKKPKIKREKKTCNWCNGSGSRYIGVTSPMGDYARVKITCDNCGGSGKV